VKENITLEDVRAAGVDTSKYLLIDGQYWLVAADAAALISYVNDGRPIDTRYLSNPVRRGELHPKKPGMANFALYSFDELIMLRVKSCGRAPGATLSEEVKQRISEANKERWAERRA
jgi:hypothetical protein